MPTIRILEFNELANFNLDSNIHSNLMSNLDPSLESNYKSNSEICTISNSNLYLESKDKTNRLKEDKESRKNQIIEALRLDHLNNDERTKVERLIDQNADCFYLLEELL